MNEEIPIPRKPIGRPATRPRIFKDFLSFLYSSKVSFSPLPPSTEEEYSMIGDTRGTTLLNFELEACSLGVVEVK